MCRFRTGYRTKNGDPEVTCGSGMEWDAMRGVPACGLIFDRRQDVDPRMLTVQLGELARGELHSSGVLLRGV